MSEAFSLQAENLCKDYKEGSGDKLHILKDINLTIHPGKSIAIIGDSGSGKTTLLNLLGGLDEPSRGAVKLNDNSFESMNEKARCRFRNRHLGFIYQFHHLLPEFTALENVAMPLLIDGIATDVAAKQSEEMLKQVGLGARIYHKPGELSGGERQRTAIARALIHSPGCVLADEPTGNLDKANANQVLDLILEMNNNIKTAFVIVTHDHHIASQMDITYHLEDGILSAVNS